MLPFDSSVGYSTPILLLQQTQPSIPALRELLFTSSLTTESPVCPPVPCLHSVHTRTVLSTSPGTLWEPIFIPLTSSHIWNQCHCATGATVNSRACVAHSHRQTLCGQENLPCLPLPQHPLPVAPAVFSPPGLLRTEGEDKEKGVQPKSPMAASPPPCRHLTAPHPHEPPLCSC